MTISDGKKRVTLALDAPLLDRVDARAAERGQDRDRVIEAMLRCSLERQARRGRKGRGIWWYPHWIILDAKALRDAARYFGPHHAEEGDPRVNLSGGSRRRLQLVLLALAAEIALKAWQVREREGRAPDHRHELDELFDALSDETRERLQAREQVRGDPLGVESADPSGMVGIREVLEFHRDTFEKWRYPYEPMPCLLASPSQLDEAISAIIETYFEPGLHPLLPADETGPRAGSAVASEDSRPVPPAETNLRD